MAARTFTRTENLKILETLFGDKFDYTETIFKTARDKITYWCKKHECYVTQQLANHRNGQQCPKCARELAVQKNAVTFETFQNRANKMYNNRFIYDSDSYTNMSTLIKIYCTIHDFWFEQTPTAHLRYVHGCPKCAESASYGPKEQLRSNKIDILNRLESIHPEFKEFNFDEVPDKIRLDEKYEVQHITCGTWFLPRFSALLNNGHGGYSSCPICSRLKKYILSDNGGKIDLINEVSNILGDGYSFEKLFTSV